MPDKTRILEIAPWWALARSLRSIENVEYHGIDLIDTGPHVTTIADVSDLPFIKGSIDLIFCIHVLEHVRDDRHAMAELHRVLKPGGQAIISVPLRVSESTLEDPTIVTPEDRKRWYGEEGHVRFYGLDIVERLETAGFKVNVDLATNIADGDIAKFGLRTDENILHCYKTA